MLLPPNIYTVTSYIIIIAIVFFQVTHTAEFIFNTYNVGTRARDAILAAVDDYRRLSCVNFIPRTNERDYVRFFRGNG